MHLRVFEALILKVLEVLGMCWLVGFEGLGRWRVLVGAHHKGHKGSGVELFACALPHSNTSGMSKAQLDDVRGGPAFTLKVQFTLVRLFLH